MRFLGGLFTFGTFSLFSGMMFVASVFWWHGRDLPSTAQLASYEPATLSRVYSGDGALLAEFSRERRLYTPIEEIPELVRHAFISAEDKNFYRHAGVDYLGLLKAMADNARRLASGGKIRGASTITQQVMKNFLLSGDRRVSRKIRELLLAFRIETTLSKDQILELYLNEIYLGQRAYGVTTAALRYFGKKLEDLTPAEAAYLAALPKAPSTYHPVRQKERATYRRDYVLKEMRENGYITLEDYEAAVATELTTVLGADAADRADRTLAQEPPPIDFFSEEIRRELVQELGEDRVYAGGLAIRATVDPDLQDLARRTLQSGLFDFARGRGYPGPAARLAEDVDLADEAAWRVALDAAALPDDVAPWRRAVVLEVGKRSARIGIAGVESAEPIYLLFTDVKDWARRRDGDKADGDPILGPEPEKPSDVWAVGDVLFVEEVAGDDGKPAWSMRIQPEVNGALVAIDPRTGRVLAMQGGFSFDASVFNRVTQATRQPGSAIKPFVYAAALENGYRPTTIVLDAPVTLPSGGGETWKPRNYSGRFYGPAPLRWGIEKSHNLMTVRLAMDVGLERVADYTRRLGVYDQMPLLYSYALGSGETTLMRLTASYAMFANGGRLIEPTLIDRIQNRHGVTIYRHDARICTGCSGVDWAEQPEPYVPETGDRVIDPVTAFQITSMLEGVTTRGTAAKIGKALGFPVAGKTGTTNEARDAWFIGFSPELAVGCYIGYDTPRPLGSGASGGKLCAPIFQSFMAAATDDGPHPSFRRPAGAVLVRINRNNGCAVPDDRTGPDFIDEAFRVDDAPQIGECPRNEFNFGLEEGAALTPTPEAPFDPAAAPFDPAAAPSNPAAAPTPDELQSVLDGVEGAGEQGGRPRPRPSGSLRTDGVY